MNIETLKVFRDLVESGSFSKTAELNYISQSAVSQQLKKLELVLKSRLLGRVANSLVLTPAGKKLYETSKKIVALYEASMLEIKQLSSVSSSGEVRISTIYSAGPYLVQDYIRRFLAGSPGTRIKLEYRQFSQVCADVSGGRADFGFLACHEKKISGLSKMEVAQDEMVVIAGAGSPLCAKKNIGLQDLNGLDFVFFDKSFPSRRYIDDFLKKNGISGNVRMELDNVDTIKTMVASGAGISILPASTVRETVKNGHLRVFRFSDAKVSRPLYLIYDTKRKLSSSAKLFKEMLEKGGSGEKKAA